MLATPGLVPVWQTCMARHNGRSVALAAAWALVLAACGGGGGGDGQDVAPSPTPPVVTPGPTPTDPAPTTPPADTRAADLAKRLGKPARLLVGLGTGSSISAIQSQALNVDLFDVYLPDAGGASWVNFNSPAGSYVDRRVEDAASIGAVPMFTLYQMAVQGDGNLAPLSDRTAMATYWSHTVLLFDRLAAANVPALVNLEPDFWGYVQYQTAAGSDPAQRFAYVNITGDCAALPNTVAGMARCLMTIARKRAPKAAIGFPPADFGFGTDAVIRFMRSLGAQDADFVVMQTLDRDAGCFEARSTTGECTGRTVTNPYWDATNTRSPNFHEHFAEARRYRDGLGQPLLWWQTPMGVPSTVAGGSTGRFRDNRVDYFLRHPDELVAAGAMGVVFSVGQAQQTTISTDAGQFQARLNAYLAKPQALR